MSVLTKPVKEVELYIKLHHIHKHCDFLFFL